MPKTKNGGYIIDETAGEAEMKKRIEEEKKKREKTDKDKKERQG